MVFVVSLIKPKGRKYFMNKAESLEKKTDTEQKNTLENTPAKLEKKENLLVDFIDFIKKYGVVGLAVGVVIGQAVTKLVNSLVDNIINRILAKVLGLVDLGSFSPFDIKIGSFITDLINFIIITFVVYISIRFFIIRFLGDEEKIKLNLEIKK
jgi:large conductance mechanosensitive channel